MLTKLRFKLLRVIIRVRFKLAKLLLRDITIEYWFKGKNPVISLCPEVYINGKPLSARKWKHIAFHWKD